MKKIYIALFILFTLSSCYKDLGNYEYGSLKLPQITISDEITYKLPKEGSLQIKVTPQLKLEEGQNESQFIYLWKISEFKALEKNEWKEAGTEKELKFSAEAKAINGYILWLSVTDKITGLTFNKQIRAKAIKPYYRTWFVYQNQNSAPLLGSIDGDGNAREVTPDIFTAEGIPGNFTGVPLFMIANPNHAAGFFASGKETVLEIFTTNGGYMLDGSSMKIRYSYPDMLLHLKNNPSIKANPEYASANQGEVIINSGTMWYALKDGFSIYYPVKVSADAGTEHYITHVNTNIKPAISYDKKNHMFLKYSNHNITPFYWTQKSIRDGNYGKYNINGSVNSPQLIPIGESANRKNAFNPDNIGADKEMLYIGTSTLVNNTQCNVLAVAKSSDGKVYVYELNGKGLAQLDGAYCSGYYSFMPTGKLSAKTIASSGAFDKIFFYADGNKIYRVDLNRSSPRDFLIYEDPDKGAVFHILKFRSESSDVGKENEKGEFIWENLPHYLACAVKRSSGEESVLEIKMNPAGDIHKDSKGRKVLYEFKGFKNIVDIAYSYGR